MNNKITKNNMKISLVIVNVISRLENVNAHYYLHIYVCIYVYFNIVTCVKMSAFLRIYLFLEQRHYLSRMYILILLLT